MGNGNNNNNQNNNSASTGSGGGAGNSSDQQQRTQQQDVQNVLSQHQQQQQQHLQQQLQYHQQQQQQQHNATYSPQIITVNNLVSSYANAAAAQNLSPTSPNESSHIVQSVYSQGPTPTQSPVHHLVAGNASGNVNQMMGGNTAAGGSAAGNQVVKRKRSVNPQGDENFIRALEAVRSGGIGFCKAARLYGVNNRTLWLEYKKRGYPVSRPSIKSRVVKLENLSPSPTPPANMTGDDNTNENYEHMAAAAVAAAAQTAALNMQIPPTSDTPTPSLMCAPHHSNNSTAGTTATHPAMGGVMSFLDTRHLEFPGSLHSMSRQRYIDATGGANQTGAGTISVNPAAAMNLQSINFNSI